MTFDVKQSQQGSIALSVQPKTVDIGVSQDGLGRVRQQHSGIMVTSGRLASDQDIDHAIDAVIAELEDLRGRAKQLLGSLKR